jgi:hypothetical protein
MRERAAQSVIFTEATLRVLPQPSPISGRDLESAGHRADKNVFDMLHAEGCPAIKSWKSSRAVSIRDV